MYTWIILLLTSLAFWHTVYIKAVLDPAWTNMFRYSVVEKTNNLWKEFHCQQHYHDYIHNTCQVSPNRTFLFCKFCFLQILLDVIYPSVMIVITLTIMRLFECGFTICSTIDYVFPFYKNCKPLSLASQIEKQEVQHTKWFVTG